jgi:hypothetical protein
LIIFICCHFIQSGIALTSGFASVYTEKVIKSSRKNSSIKDKDRYGLAHMQCQLALVSLIILGFYAAIKDSKEIMKNVCDLVLLLVILSNHQFYEKCTHDKLSSLI